MSDPIISVENLGKRYRIDHQAQRGSYKTLREVAVARAKGLVGRFKPGRSSEELASRTTREDFWALKDVSFEVKRGEVLGIIGRNGAGKSTLLKVLSRITEPTTGRVRINGRVASLLEVGTGFHPELTGRENIFLNGAILGMSKVEIKRKFDEIVAFSEVEKFLDTPVKRYSSGMYVRLAFAVAAHLEPEILIVDEVLAVGDAEFQQKCLGKMDQVAKGGRTVLFVSHNMPAVIRLCTRGILLRAGHVELDGEISQVAGAYFSDASASSNGEFDLSNHPARSASSTPLIRKLRLYKSDGSLATRLLSDEAFSLEIDYETAHPISRSRWALAIEDNLGRRIMTLASYFQEGHTGPVSGRGTIRCSSGPLNLGSGRYLLSVSVGEQLLGLVDSVDGAAWFEVAWNNNFINGEPYNQVYGPVLRESRWELLDSSRPAKDSLREAMSGSY